MKSNVQIIATLGPSSENTETIGRMIDVGMDVARLNFSHGQRESHAQYVRILREAAAARARTIPIIQDLSGPRTKTEAGHTFDPNILAVTDKDIADLSFARDLGIEWIAQSYVGSARDLMALRSHMKEAGVTSRLIAKIERKEAIENFAEILDAADAIMVARGDLGDAIPIEDVPFVQQDIVHKTNDAGKPVIVATQMLFSMVNAASPTRAEVTDVAFAILIGADVIMLSDETAKGTFPVESVQYMERIAMRAEKDTQRPAKHFL